MTSIIRVCRNRNSLYIKVPKKFADLDCFSNKRVNFIGRSDFSIRFAKCLNNLHYKDARLLCDRYLYIPKDLCRIYNISERDRLLIYTDFNNNCFIRKFDEIV